LAVKDIAHFPLREERGREKLRRAIGNPLPQLRDAQLFYLVDLLFDICRCRLFEAGNGSVLDRPAVGEHARSCPGINKAYGCVFFAREQRS
jgi:hypothetical protein